MRLGARRRLGDAGAGVARRARRSAGCGRRRRRRRRAHEWRSPSGVMIALPVDSPSQEDRLECPSPGGSASREPGRTTSRTSPSRFRTIGSPSSPASPAPASRRWPSTRSSRRGSGGTSSRCRTYARMFLDRVDRPDVDRIENIRPAVALEQKNPVRTARSTVGTATEVYDYLRLLYAKIGRVHCPRVRQPGRLPLAGVHRRHPAGRARRRPRARHLRAAGAGRPVPPPSCGPGSRAAASRASS